MKMSTVTVGAGCTVGPRAVVLYDAELEAGAELDALSLAMKGESLPAETPGAAFRRSWSSEGAVRRAKSARNCVAVYLPDGTDHFSLPKHDANRGAFAPNFIFILLGRAAK